MDHQKRRSLLGTAVLALISGCLERDREGPDVSIEDAVNMLVRGEEAERDQDESGFSVPAQPGPARLGRASAIQVQVDGWPLGRMRGGRDGRFAERELHSGFGP